MINTYIFFINKLGAMNQLTVLEDETLQACLKEYKSAAMDTDVMIGKLFKHLEDTGLINNTAVMLYADHNAYYQNLSKNIKGTQNDGCP